jgi:hypothetical protein
VLRGNELTRLPNLEAALGLTSLDVSHNHLKALDKLLTVTSLTTLNVAYNDIKSLISLRTLSLNTNLKSLTIYPNPLTFSDRYASFPCSRCVAVNSLAVPFSSSGVCRVAWRVQEVSNRHHPHHAAAAVAGRCRLAAVDAEPERARDERLGERVGERELQDGARVTDAIQARSAVCRRRAQGTSMCTRW